MKVLRVLGLIFGILLLLTGGGLLAGAAVADRAQSAVDQEMVKQGLEGPVDGVVKSADTSTSTYQVAFTAKDGNEYTATAVSTLSTPPEVGDTVTVFYKADDPTIAGIADVPTTALGNAAGPLRTSGIIALVVGAVLLVASILGFVLGKKSPKALPAQQYAGAGYPAQAPQQPGGYPQQPSGSYPQQSGAYPQQPGASSPQQAAGGAYPQQQSGSYPQQSGAYPQQAGGSYPQQPSPYPPRQQGYPTPPAPYPPQPPSGSNPQQ